MCTPRPSLEVHQEISPPGNSRTNSGKETVKCEYEFHRVSESVFSVSKVSYYIKDRGGMKEPEYPNLNGDMLIRILSKDRLLNAESTTGFKSLT